MGAEVSFTTARELGQGALASLRNASDLIYADLRFVDEEREVIRVRNGAVEAVTRKRESGFGIRVLVRGGWGFACAVHAHPEALERAGREALAVARASARASSTPPRWIEMAAATGPYKTPNAEDPLAVPLDRKVSDLLAAIAPLRAGDGAVRVAEGKGDFARRRQLLLSTEGTDVEQTFFYTGAGIVAYATSTDGRAQRRSYPASVDGDLGQGGYERVRAMRLAEEAVRVRAEVLDLLAAPPCPSGQRDVVLESSQLALQIHESCGHPVELDRALGTEVSLAGGSFLQPSMLGRYRYGSPIVDLVADATSAGGLGTFGFDDEGVPGQRVSLVKEGIFSGYLSSRETAAATGVAPSGAMRADAHNRIPLIRMVNINLEPREGSFEDLLADSDGALLLETNKSWSIDDLRLGFQFGCEVAWEIRGGKKVEMYRDPVYAGTTPVFWGSCDAIAGPEAWRLWGIGNCGKGEPMQIMRVGHGTAPARFRGVEVAHG